MRKCLGKSICGHEETNTMHSKCDLIEADSLSVSVPVYVEWGIMEIVLSASEGLRHFGLGSNNVCYAISVNVILIFEVF